MARPRAQRQSETAARAAAERASVAHIAYLAGVSQASVVDATTGGGCPRNEDGTLSWSVVRAWAQAHGRLGYAKPALTATQTDHRSALDRFKALNAEAEYNERIGKLIPREEAERAQIRLALEFKASLMTLADQLPMQLANLPAREVEARLRERVAWMLGRSQDGHVPIPQALVDAIARLVAEIAAAEPAR